jgi:predicted ArsR family transcriptional regulator
VSQARFDADLTGLASLAEPTRRALYRYVRDRGTAVSRDEAAAGVGVPRHQAKFHLDRLVDDGLLEAEFARRTGRQGPGAGRPAKLYRRGSRELAVTVPERRYELAGQLMARAIADARSTGQPAGEALDRAARDRGGELAGLARQEAGGNPSHAALLAAVRAALDEEGYQTRTDPAGLTLANCPFRALAAEHTALICGMNLAIMEGLLDRLDRPGGLGLAAVLDPAEGRCCVRLAGSGG